MYWPALAGIITFVLVDTFSRTAGIEQHTLLALVFGYAVCFAWIYSPLSNHQTDGMAGPEESHNWGWNL